MKNLYITPRNFILPAIFLLVLLFLITTKSESNWIRQETRINNPQLISNSHETTEPESVSDSLPPGINDDWLNNLVDENGNPVFEGRKEEPETDAMQRKVFNGLAANSQYGYSISSAGDVNGDGFDDIIIGASYYNTNAGRAYIYYGGQNMNTVPDVIMTGAANDFFGNSVSTADDVNGDGYADVIVGANGYSTNTGRAYVFFGGALMNNVADVTMTGGAAGYKFGISVSSAGDVNGDGYSDVIVGANGYLTNTGIAYIFYGGLSMNNVEDVILSEGSTNIFYGTSVSTAGDVNGDGYSDVIVGAFGYSSNAGRAYIYIGGASMNTFAAVTLNPEAAGSFFGYSVSSAGDVNGDGYSDVIVGAYGYSSSTGRSYIFYGGFIMNNFKDVTLTGETTGDQFGRSVSSAGDINGDGYSDVIAGAWNHSTATGKAYIFFGGTSMNNGSDVTMTGEAANNQHGWSVSSAGDVNGDGYSDVIVGANGYSGNTGRVYLYDYFLKNEIINDLTMTGEAANDYFGASVSSAGDVNGDGYSDVIVGANRYSGNKGRVYIYFGGVLLNNIADVVITGDPSSSLFGISVSSAGDVNGDGFSDVIVGASDYGVATGRAYIFFGGTSMDNVEDVILTGEAFDNNFGYSVSSAGDVNGDGYADVIVGANRYSSSRGRIYIYFGGATMDNDADFKVASDLINNEFGYSVSSAGDVNDDGFSDVIVGAYGYQSNTGSSYVYFGGTSMDSIADVNMTGEVAGDRFGNSVASAGDVNGDGYSDVIVGAFRNSTNSGRAYVFFGGVSMNNTADVTMTGEAIANFFGNSVSSVGDVNGDGYSDVIAGAQLYSSIGRAYIFFGGNSMDGVADIIMTGESTNSSFGYSVSSTGDVNGDGYPDFTVGAPGVQGRAYIFTSSAISVKPILIHVRDVPNDQGGKLELKWARSANDGNGINSITSYSIFRSLPPSGGNFAWQEIAIVNARMLPFYSYLEDTPFDSTSGNQGSLYYRIRANTSSPVSFYYSAILHGRSIDNISPPIVSPFTAAQSGINVRLDWGNNSAPDLLNYILFRSTSQSINPFTEPVFATTTDLTYLDTFPLSGLYYYFIVAQDIHNNKSPVAVTESPNIKLNLTMFIEGFYNAGSNSQISDAINVELRNSVSPFGIADQTTAVVNSNGTVQLKFANALSGNYYFAIKHRNAVETWSNAPIAFSYSTPVNFDLSASLSQAYGSNQIQTDISPVRFAIYSGDVNQDGIVDVADASDIDNDAFNFASGYLPTDVNGDEVIDLADAVFADNNGFNFVGKVTP
ncbi:MAG: FG-GAP-like repeat-containing protein [Ignavibacteria bacterium]